MCDILDWNNWSQCNATCGGGSRLRNRKINCNANWKPFTLENCLKNCNITDKKWMTKGMEHELCKPSCHNGTYNYIKQRCTCSIGFSGICCEKDKDECKEKPCQYGQCRDRVNDFYCKCHAFFEGKRCSEMKIWAIAFVSAAVLALMMLTCLFLFCIKKYGKDNNQRIEPQRNRNITRPTSKPCAWP
ncbi:JAG1 [Mytilus coruscus]|uniref:JAG1 n=1 Tax=Mytilus coruscus TaxID=42192 RepID=A0A6J8CSV7_MYTCO|nr:JAG1 [Mytilus coruscus]